MKLSFFTLNAGEKFQCMCVGFWILLCGLVIVCAGGACLNMSRVYKKKDTKIIYNLLSKKNTVHARPEFPYTRLDISVV